MDGWLGRSCPCLEMSNYLILREGIRVPNQSKVPGDDRMTEATLLNPLKFSQDKDDYGFFGSLQTLWRSAEVDTSNAPEVYSNCIRTGSLHRYLT